MLLHPFRMIGLGSGVRATGDLVEQQERERLAEVMRLVAGGDREAVVALYVEFGGRVLAVVRRHRPRHDDDPGHDRPASTASSGPEPSTT